MKRKNNKEPLVFRWDKEEGSSAPKVPNNYGTLRLVVFILVVVFITAFTTHLVEVYFSGRVLKIQSPIKIQAPIWVENKTLVTPLLVATESAVIATPTPSPFATNLPTAKPLPTATPVLKPRVQAIPGSAKAIVLAKAAKAFGEEHVQAFENLINKESHFNPQAINPSSGACGIFQALPCSKLPCQLEDVDCQADWGVKYIASRYGNPTEAWNFHQKKGWY